MEYLPKFSEECAAAGKEPINIQNFPGHTDANLALTSGRIDAVVADSVSLAYQAEEAGGQFELAEGEDYDPSPFGVALGKDTGLQDAVSEAVRGVLDSDYYEELAEKWGIPQSTLISSETLDQK
jgi:polar amino acid transport system substrate-binding protein